MADISQLKTPDNTTYNLKDASARTDIALTQEVIDAAAEIGIDLTGHETQTAVEQYSVTEIVNMVIDKLDEDGKAIVVDHGTSGNWTYSKWSNGRFEAWFQITGRSTGTLTQVGSMSIYNATTYGISFPNIGITKVDACIPNVHSESNNYLLAATANVITTSKANVLMYRIGGNTSALSLDWELYIAGTWSE